MSDKRKDSIRTIINEEKGTVTVVIKGCVKDAITTIERRLKAQKLPTPFMENEYVGVAYCDNSDTFDKNIGCNLAAKRAMDKHKKAHIKAIKDWQIGMLRVIRNVCPNTFDEIMVDKARELRFKGQI